VIVGPRPALETTRVQIRNARLHRPAHTVDRVKLRYRSRPLACHIADEPEPAPGPEPGRHATLTLELTDPVEGAAPGQLACLMDGELVVGWGTIARDRDARRERRLASSAP